MREVCIMDGQRNNVSFVCLECDHKQDSLDRPCDNCGSDYVVLRKNPKKGVLLDFASLTDPRSLFQSLILYQQTHNQIYVGRCSVDKVCVFWDRADGGEYYFDLRDPDLLNYMTGFDMDDVSLAEWNLPLAIKIFQHAIKEGLIEVLPEESNEDIEAAGYLMTKEERSHFVGIQTYYYGPKATHLTIVPDIPSSFLEDIYICLLNGCQLSVTDARFVDESNDPLGQSVFLEKTGQGKLIDTLRHWQPKSLSEIFVALSHPPLLTGIVDTTVALMERKKLKKDMLMFTPRFLLNRTSSGLFGLLELLYRVYRSRNDKKND
jgi:hypothetical protein